MVTETFNAVSVDRQARGDEPMLDFRRSSRVCQGVCRNGQHTGIFHGIDSRHAALRGGPIIHQQYRRIRLRFRSTTITGINALS